MAKLVCKAEDILGECPRWRGDALWWVDIERGLIHRWTEAGGREDVAEIGARTGAFAFAAGGDLVVAGERGLGRWSPGGGLDWLADPEADKPTRFNDGRVDPQGRFWAGTMALDPEDQDKPMGSLYRFDPDRSVHLMETGLTISNGLDWSLDGATFYLTDTLTRRIFAYDFDSASGAISNRRVLVATAEEDGFPDGLAVDAEGFLWSAGFAAGRLIRYRADGTLDRRVDLPTRWPTACAFGAHGLRTLFVTTSRHLAPPGANDPLAGAVLRTDPGVAGRAETDFAG